MIKFDQVYELLQQAGIPVAYQQFNGPKQEIPNPPYLVYYETRSRNFSADNITYTEKLPVIAELYTDSCRDFGLELKIKTLLSKAGLYYNTDHANSPEPGVHITYFEFTIFE